MYTHLPFTLALAATPCLAEDAAIKAFTANCFSPFLTAETARSAFESIRARHDFYDLNPVSDVPPSPASFTATPNTDRRCAVAFNGDRGDIAAQRAIAALEAEGIEKDAPLPFSHENARLPGTTLLAARFLNPGRIAVVHTGTRPGADGPETFLSVERLNPEATRREVAQ